MKGFLWTDSNKELIDTLWNVNKTPRFRYLGGVIELIDTLWNVNMVNIPKLTDSPPELIDTLWNVNLILRT